MEKLVRTGSNDSPEIHLDPENGILRLGGSSLPENVLEVYKPVSDWLDEYGQNPQPHTEVNFFFEYLNTASSHMIMQIMEKFLHLREVCEVFEINWFYDPADMDMRDFGAELSELTHLPVNLIARDLEY